MVSGVPPFTLMVAGRLGSPLKGVQAEAGAASEFVAAIAIWVGYQIRVIPEITYNRVAGESEACPIRRDGLRARSKIGNQNGVSTVPLFGAPDFG
jgi:hypothetical protein